MDAEQLRWYLSLQEARLQKGFHDLRCLPDLTIEPTPWQMETAIKVLRDMQGSAILADEVGLGKTIEAGLIMKELLHRGLISSALILVPAPLVEQWKEEMQEKFGLTLADYREEGVGSSPLLISSLPYASRDAHRRHELETFGFDLVIVDEAHSLKNQRTQSYKFVYKIHRTYTLLMSATPIQNSLKELFNLVNLLKPGYLESRKRFHERYVEDRFTPRNVAGLRRLLSDVMIRHKRSNTLVELPKRNSHALEFTLPDDERSFHDDVLSYARTLHTTGKRTGIDVLSLIGLLKQNASSPASVVRYLQNNFPTDDPWCTSLIERGQAIRYPEKARQLVKRLREQPEPCLVYTEFRGTLSLLEETLEREGISYMSYHGSLTAKQKQRIITSFREGEAQVLLCTESGSQGLNLQHCHIVYNYDLPWNPMRIEQRIGRVHRFGQTEEVDIYTMATKGTLDEYILYLLTHKIHLFELVIGELDTIMSYALDDQPSLDIQIGRMILDARTADELKAQFETIGNSLIQARQTIHSQLEDNRNLLDAIGVDES